MKKGLYNILFGIGGQLITIALGIVLPRLFIINYGSETNGLLSSLNQLFSYLALMEAGVGAATLQALYGPIARNTPSAINGILSATHRFYTRIGYYYFGAVILLAVLYPLLVKSDIPPGTVMAVILLMGLGGTANFFLQGKYRLLLQAEGKQYILTNLMTGVQVLTSIAKIVLINLGCNIVVLQAAHFVLVMAQMAYIAIHIRRHYGWIDLRALPDMQAISQRNYVLVHQVATLVLYRTDVVVLSIFCGLKVTSVYVIYNMLFEMISTLMQNLSSGVSYKLGQTYNSDHARYRRIYIIFDTYFQAVSFALFLVGYLFMLPFVRRYTSGVTDINYLDYWLPLLFVVNKLLISARTPAVSTSAFAGHFQQTQSRVIFQSVLNLAVSLAGVIWLGVYGVLIGTTVSALYYSNTMIRYTNRVLLQQSAWRSYRVLLVDAILFIGFALVHARYQPALTSYGEIIGWGLAYAVMIIPIFLLVNSLLEREAAWKILGYLRRKLRQRMRAGMAIPPPPVAP